MDLKQLTKSVNGFEFCAVFIDEYTRYVWVQFMKRKSELLGATELVKADYEANVSIPTSPDGVNGERPRFYHIHSDHEGVYESHAFTEWRIENLVHHTMSPPHDHDLNGIAERVIAVIESLTIAAKESSGCPVGLWPYLVLNAVNWHNSVAGSVGSSTVDSEISPYTRFTGRPTKVMDLMCFGARTVVSIPEGQNQPKTTLPPKGEIGCFLGRSKTSIGCYNVWCKGRVVNSSSIAVDEEYFPWRGDDAHQPLTPIPTPTIDPSPLSTEEESDEGAPLPPDTQPTPGETVRQLNEPTPTELSFCSLYSGEYLRSSGLPEALASFGWTNVTQIDNHPTKGGGGKGMY